MNNAWAQFEATLRRELGRNNSSERENQEIPSASALLKKDDIFLFGSGSLSNLVVVNCHICGALTKPAFLKHHVTKLHGAARIDPAKPLVSKDVERTKLLDPGPCRRTPPKEPPPIKMTLRCPPAPAAPAKAKGRKQTKSKKPSKKKEEKKELRGLLSSQTLSDKSGKRKLHSSSQDAKAESGESSRVSNGVFDFKHLLNRLPTVNPNSAFYRTSSHERRERSNGLLYQSGPVKPLSRSTCRHGRSAGSGQVLFTRQYDNLIASFSSLFPSRPVHKCTSELRSPEGTGIPGVDEEERLDSPDKLSDKLSDVIDPDILDDKSLLLTEGLYNDSFLWSDYMDAKPAKQATPPPPRASLPKLKVNTSQIKSKSAMAVFEFEDTLLGEGRGRCKAGPEDGKGKRKLNKSPSQANPVRGSSTESPTPNSKRSRYEVIELDNTPSPEQPLPQLSSPRQFSYMVVGYSEQSAT